MAAAELQLKTVLGAAGGVTALVADRVFPDEAPDGTALPCVAYRRSDTEFFGTLSGEIGATRALMDCWCLASSRGAAEEVANAVVAASAAAKFVVQSRHSEYDSDGELWAAIVGVNIWE